MSRQTLIVSFSMAVAVLTMLVAGFLVVAQSRPRPSPELLTSIQYLDGRLDDLEERLASGLRELDRRPFFPQDDLRALSGDGSPNPGADLEDTGYPPADGGEDDGETVSAIDGILTRLRDFETRLRGLEEDPVERGYSYLASENFELRRQGLFTLERVAKYDPQALAAIRDTLQDADPRVRAAALDTLADLDDKEAVPWIAPLLADGEASVRRETIETLGRLGGEQAGGEIARLLADEDASVRSRAADTLGRLKYGDAAPGLLQALQDPNDEVRGQAIASLGEVGAKEAIPALRELYNGDAGRNRFRVIHALKNLGDNQPYQQEFNRMAKTALEDPNEDSRRNALRTLSWFARDDAKKVAQAIVDNPEASERIRREAQRVLGGDRGGRGR
jgi:HEAT repeat protein